MKQGFLSQYFNGVAVKKLSSVEANPCKSNQHEFNGVEELRKILGEPTGKKKFRAKYAYLDDQEGEPLFEDGFMTWYDARQKAREERKIMRWECRLYFPTNYVTQLSNEGDILIVARQQDDILLVIIAKADTTIACQILWLFGYSELPPKEFSIRTDLETDHDRIGFISLNILENIGINLEVTESEYLDDTINKFGGTFPSTMEFSRYARSTLNNIDSNKNFDEVLLSCMEREENLFRSLEKHIINEKLTKEPFENVDSFIEYSLSVINRRKSRAGFALENHLEILFQNLGIQYTRSPVTENRAKPDFIFPGIKEYKNPEFDPSFLYMLGVKSTCKERWRQVLTEAERIIMKHLLTLETSISIHQTNEMQAHNLQLIVPLALHKTYQPDQQKWLMSISDFIQLVKDNQYRHLIPNRNIYNE